MRPPLRVLEIGCGEGRALLELRRRFPDAALHGINRHPWDAMRGSESLPDVARFHTIFTEAELAAVALPVIHFLDAQRLPFADGSFDVVLSQGAIHYMARKDRVLEEVWRVLAPEGEAFLHIDTWQDDLPDVLEPPTPRIAISRAGRPLAVRTLVEEVAGAGFDVSYAERTLLGRSICIRMRRNTAAPLPLGLTLDAAASGDLRELTRDQPRGDVCWGYRSVFRA